MHNISDETSKEYKAFIDEENCIGCGKCVRVCPTDAIVGSKHVLHTILPQFCTSCSNCINACPTDCITLSTLGTILNTEEELRLTQQKQQRLNQYQTVPPTIFSPSVAPIKNNNLNEIVERKQSIADAIARVKAKKNMAK